MPNLNLDLDYFDHPKTKRLIGLLGPGAAEHPIRLWCYCGKYHPANGKLTGYSDQEIESLAGWTGAPGALLAAMLKVNFVEKDDEGYSIKDWKEINGHLVAFKVRARKAARKRWSSYKHATSIKERCLTNAPTLPTIPNQTNNKTGFAATRFFEEVWKLYPNKDGKKEAQRHFLATVKTPQEFALIMKALSNYLASDRVRKGFIKNGSTWFNNWRDWLAYDPNPAKTSADDRAAKWRAAGLSECHGSGIEPDDDGIPRCNSCIQAQNWYKPLESSPV